MKKLFLILSIFFISYPCFAIDTELLNVSLTDKQFTQTEGLKSEVINGFAYWGEEKKLVVTSVRALTSEEIASLEQSVAALPDEYTKKALLTNFNPEIAIAREAQVFDAQALVRLMPFSYVLNELIRFKNFCGGVSGGVQYAGLKQIGLALVGAGQITQSDYDSLSGILLEQGICLEECE
jgi:hypothetical protein